MSDSISCIMVTTPDRLLMAMRAMSMFARQTHLEREFVVATTRAQPELIEFADYLGIRSKFIEHSGGLSVGRNAGISVASSQWICLWDDDDFHAANRLEVQYAAVHDADACFLTRQLLVGVDNRVHLMDWLHAERSYPRGLIPGTALFNKALAVDYVMPDTGIGDDSVVRDQLCAAHRVVGVPQLVYIRIFHGGNTVSREQFKRMINRKSVPVESYTDGDRDAVKRLLLEWREPSNGGRQLLDTGS